MTVATDFARPLDFEDPGPVAEEVRRACERVPALREFGERLGGTTLMEVPNPLGGARVFAKCEWENPAGSVKDRVAYVLLCRLVAGDEETPVEEIHIIEYSGGNLAAALSALKARMGFQLTLVLSDASAPSLLAKLGATGCEVELVDKERGFVAVVDRALEMAAADPSLRLLYQHRNAANVAWHEMTTGAEIVESLRAEGLRASAWTTAIGTGGTLIGVARALSAAWPEVRVVGVSPAELVYGTPAAPNGLPKLAGSGGFGNGVRQPFVRGYGAGVSAHSAVSFDEALSAMCRFRDLTDGVRIGTSAAANWVSACQLAQELDDDADGAVVTLFPDAGNPEEWSKAEAAVAAARG